MELPAREFLTIISASLSPEEHEAINAEAVKPDSLANPVDAIRSFEEAFNL